MGQLSVCEAGLITQHVLITSYMAAKNYRKA